MTRITHHFGESILPTTKNQPTTETSSGAPRPRHPSAGTDVGDDHLALRRPPIQGRGVATFERILSTAAELLIEVGAEGLTTNLIASRSGVNISSIYKYFPNKQAILVALFERHNQQRTEAAHGIGATLANATSWEQVVDRSVDRILMMRRATPGNVALRQAMRSSPELAEIDRRANVYSAKWLADQLRALTGLSARRAAVVARIAIEAQVAAADWWESPEGGRAPMVSNEIKAMLKAYIRLYVPAPRRKPRKAAAPA